MVGKIKGHDQKPQAIDTELLQVFSDPERRLGFRAPGGVGCGGLAHEPFEIR